ncbi:MAG TPA: hypothetical protein VGJ09_11855, partial [Bryobacteraceae bacterium]
MIRRADVIVVGTIARLDVAAKPAEGQCSVLLRVELLVENVLKGSASEQSLDYYYFGPFCGIAGPVESLELGSRSIFFLNKDQGYWRAVADYWRNRLPVASGSHASEFNPGKSIEQAIAEVLLIPGDRYSASGFASAIQTEAAPTARSLAGSTHANQLL